MSKSVAYVTTSILALIATPAFADEADAGDNIVVSATRMAVTVDEVPASLTVIDKAGIDASQALTVSDLLVRTPGVTLSRNGGYGTTTQVRIRGGDPDQTVLVIDGVKMFDPASAGGGYNFANLTIGDATQVEILRGPQSILWGSQAIGGVVNLVTAAPEKALEGSVDLEAGSRETISARAAIGGITGPVRWRLSGFSLATDGISALSPRRGATERDGYHTRGGNGRVSVDLGGGALVDLRGYYSTGQVDIDATTGDTPAYNTTEEMFGYAGIVVPLFDGRLTNRLGYSRTRTTREGFDPRRARPLNLDATGWVERLEYQGTLRIAEGWQATFGAERENSRFRYFLTIPANPATAIPAAARSSARLDSLYAQISARVLPFLTLNGGLRRDDHDQFGGKTVFGGGAVVSLLGDTTLLRANYGEGFKAPTLYQLHSDSGNADLKPEQSKGWEAGVEQRLFDRKVALTATYYERKADNMILYNACSGAPTGLCLVPGSSTVGRGGYYSNIARTDTRGVELGASADFGGLHLTGNYSWTDSENLSAGFVGKAVKRVPKHTANAEASYAFDFGLTLGGAVRWSGKAFDNDANSFVLDDYTLVDLRVSFKAAEGLEVYGRVENLFDEYYETARNYNSLGRGFSAGIRGRF